jgi:viroplasmin and RNaseH domain-containing protein
MSPLFEDEFQNEYYKGRKPAGHSDDYYYVVFIGREIGIYDNWDDAKFQTHKFSKGHAEKYSTYGTAEVALREYLNTGILPFENRK